MRNVGDIVCWECEMLWLWDVRDVEYLEYGMFGMWDVRNVGC